MGERIQVSCHAGPSADKSDPCSQGPIGIAARELSKTVAASGLLAWSALMCSCQPLGKPLLTRERLAPTLGLTAQLWPGRRSCRARLPGREAR